MRLKKRVTASMGTIFFFQAEDSIRDYKVTGVQTCALPIWIDHAHLESLARSARGLAGLLLRRVEERERDRRADFRHAVGGQMTQRRQDLARAIHDRRRARGAGSDHTGAERRQVARARLLCVDQELQVRVEAVDVRRALALDEIER